MLVNGSGNDSMKGESMADEEYLERLRTTALEKALANYENEEYLEKLRTQAIEMALANYENAYGIQALGKFIVAWFKRHGFPKELRRHL